MWSGLHRCLEELEASLHDFLNAYDIVTTKKLICNILYTCCMIRHQHVSTRIKNTNYDYEFRNGSVSDILQRYEDCYNLRLVKLTVITELTVIYMYVLYRVNGSQSSKQVSRWVYKCVWISEVNSYKRLTCQRRE